MCERGFVLRCLNRCASRWGIVLLSLLVAGPGGSGASVEKGPALCFSPPRGALPPRRVEAGPRTGRCLLSLPGDGPKVYASDSWALVYSSPPGVRPEEAGVIVGPAPGMRVAVELEEGPPLKTEPVLEDPRVPVAVVRMKDGVGRVRFQWRSLSVIPGDVEQLPRRRPGPKDAVKVECRSAPTPLPGWGRPGRPCLEAFENIVAGFDGPLHYRFRAAAGRAYTVALGFMESYHPDPGLRVQEVFIEGKGVLHLDLVRDLGRHTPGVFLFPARDEDGDGWIDLVVRPAPESRDRYPILNVLWVFPAGGAPPPEALITGAWGPRALAFLDCGGKAAPEIVPSPPSAAELVRFEKVGGGGGGVRVRVESPVPLFAEAGDRGIYRRGRRILACTHAWSTVETRRDEAAGVYLLDLALPRECTEGALLCTRGFEAGDLDLARARAEEGSACSWWRARPFPYGRIRVPDPEMQAVLQACIRMLFQGGGAPGSGMEEKVDPDDFAGTAVVPEALALLEARGAAWSWVDGLLQRAFAVEGPPGGILPCLLCRCGLLDPDRNRLWERFYAVRAFADRVGRFRSMHPGVVLPRDAWNLAGWKRAVESARRLGLYEPEVSAWEAGYEALRGALLEVLHPPGTDTATGGWQPLDPESAFLLFGPGGLLSAKGEAKEAPSSPAVVPPGARESLRRAAARARLLLRQEGGLEAGSILQDLAARAGPFFGWPGTYAGNAGEDVSSPREAALLPEEVRRAAEFVRLLRECFVWEAEGRLHLLSGIPWSWWTEAKAETVLDRVPTEYGPLTLKLQAGEKEGRGGTRLDVRLPPRFPTDRVTLYVPSVFDPRTVKVRENAEGFVVTVPQGGR